MSNVIRKCQYKEYLNLYFTVTKFNQMVCTTWPTVPRVIFLVYDYVILHLVEIAPTTNVKCRPLLNYLIEQKK